MKRLPNRPNVTMFALANRMLCRVLNRQGVSVASVAFLSGRTNEGGGGSGRGVLDRMSAEVDNEWKQRLAADFRMVSAT